MNAAPKLRQALRTVIKIHREREEELRRALEAGDADEVVRCLRRQLGVRVREAGDRAPEGK
jgi:hypothetical protein